ncbi:cytochrome oxidase assembly protein 1 [Basidiobolus ranarum]|uniref:Cytochrome oxidase assembly protein 1 n=1 Tax=Basidiobolus ranarum TaxID=34480 RepID=A0ABR2WAY2_9FUNG
MNSLRIMSKCRPFGLRGCSSNQVLRRFETTVVSKSPGAKKIPLAIERELPEPVSKTSRNVTFGVLGLSLWVVGTALAFNHHRLHTSVVDSTLFTLRHDPDVQEILGNNIKFRDNWAWISGDVNHLKGRVNVSFWIKGDKDTGRAHFASRRRGDDWEVLDFSLTTERGKIPLKGEPVFE